MSDATQGLIQRLTAAGEWPEPDLLEAILAQGPAAVAPLLAVVHRPPPRDGGQATLCYAVCLLGSLGEASVIPDLVRLFYQFDDETLEDVANSLALFGAAAVDPVLAVARDVRLSAQARAEATTAAIMAAGDDDSLRDRIAATLRELLHDYLARAATLTDDEKGMVTMLAIDLTNLADPPARPLIAAAYQAGLIDRTVLRPEDVDFYYDQGGETMPQPEATDWLQEYKVLYEEEMQARREERAATD